MSAETKHGVMTRDDARRLVQAVEDAFAAADLPRDFSRR